LVQIGQEAAARGDAVRAEQYLGLAIERGAECRTILPILLESCLRSSHLRTALNYAEPYLLEHPEDDHLRYLVANIHLSLGQAARAKRELGLILQRNAHNADAHYLLGIIESAAQPESARKHFDAVLRYSHDEERLTEVESRLAELRLFERERADTNASLVPTGEETP
jgi:tetratricopeptide (TPR) repeat protein